MKNIKKIVLLLIIQIFLTTPALARVVRPHTHAHVGGNEINTNVRGYKIKKEKVSGKEGAKDAPSWAKYSTPYSGESGSEFATRLMNDKYGNNNYKTGSESEYSQIKKWADRSFVDPN